MREIKFELIHNAIDFLRSASKYSTTEDSSSFKYAILHLDAAIELMLKARLKDDHWSLIFSDPDKANFQSLESGDFISVNINSALKRLEGICNVNICKEDKKRILSLHSFRNKIQHFEVNINKEQVKSLLSFGCQFVLRFCKEELEEDYNYYEDDFKDIKDILINFDTYVEEMMKNIKPKLSGFPFITRCPDCGQYTITTGNGDEPRCLFCEQEFDSTEIAKKIAEDGEVKICPECGRESFIFRILNNEDGGYYCVYCGESGEYVECSQCGGMYINKEGGGCICQDCFSDKLKEDD